MTIAVKRVAIAGEIATLLRFGLVGATTLGIYLGTFTLLRVIAGEFIAFTVAYVLAITFHYLSSRLFTFRRAVEQVQPRRVEFGRYGAVVVLSYLVNLATYYAATIFLGLPEQVGLVMGVLVNTTATFLLSRFWVFKP